MHRPASLAGSLPSAAQISRVLKGMVPSRRGAGKTLLVLAGLAVVLVAAVIYSPIAHPRNLEVNGVSGADASLIQDAIESTAHGQSTFAVSEGALMKSVAEYPQVSSITIHAHPPFRLDLDVVMRPAVARVEIGGRAFVLAADGTVLDRVTGVDVPKIESSIDGLEIRETKAVGARGVLRILGAAPTPLLSLARSIRSGSSGIEIVMSRGPRLIFGNSDHAADKWAAAAAVIADGPAAQGTYIDLRVPGRPAVGGLGGSKAAGYADAPPVLDASTAAAAAAATSSAATGATPSSQSTQTQVAGGSSTGTPAGSGTATGTGTGTGTAGGTASAGTGTPAGLNTQPGSGSASAGTGTDTPSPDTSAPTAGTAGAASGGASSGGASLGATGTP